jgi:phosphoribosyl 1,2-cyclic phosphodiesterase
LKPFIACLAPLTVSSCTSSLTSETNPPISHDKKPRFPSISFFYNLTFSLHHSSRILFLGTGSSIGNPMAIHLMQEPPVGSRFRRNHEISLKASIGDPRHNPNYRCNPSILIQYQLNTSQEFNIVIDTGKTFREAILRWFPLNKVRSVDAVLLTHGHADAIFGLDDIRSVQPINTKTPMPVYLSKECEQIVRKVFFYLFPSPDKNPSESMPLPSSSL